MFAHRFLRALLLVVVVFFSFQGAEAVMAATPRQPLPCPALVSGGARVQVPLCAKQTVTIRVPSRS